MSLKRLSLLLTTFICTSFITTTSLAADVTGVKTKGYELKPHEIQALNDYFLTLMLHRKTDRLGNYTATIKDYLQVESLEETNSKILDDNRNAKKDWAIRGQIDYLSPVRGMEGKISMLAFKVKGERFPILAFVSNSDYGADKLKIGDSVDLICKPKKYAPTSYQFDCITYASYAATYSEAIVQDLTERVKKGNDSLLLDADGMAIAYALSSKNIEQEKSHCLFESAKCLQTLIEFLGGPGAKSKRSTLAQIGITEYNPGVRFSGDLKFDFNKSLFPIRLELSEQQRALLASFILEKLKIEEKETFKEHNIIMVDADTLVKTYDVNEVEGDSLYLNKTLYITGKIAGIKSGISNKPYVLLKSIKTFQNPQLNFEAPNIDRISKLRKGQEIKVVCKGDGEVIGTPILKDCYFSNDFFVKTANIEADYLNSKLKAAGKIINHLPSEVIAAIYADALYSQHTDCLYKETIDKCVAADAIAEYKKKNDFPTLIYYGQTQLEFMGFRVY